MVFRSDVPTWVLLQTFSFAHVLHALLCSIRDNIILDLRCFWLPRFPKDSNQTRPVCLQKFSDLDTSRMRTPSAASFLQSELDTELLQKLFETANLTKHGATSLLQASYEEAINSGAIEFAGENSAGIIFVIGVGICIVGILVMCLCDKCCHGSTDNFWSDPDPDDSFIQTGEVAGAAEGHESKAAFLGGGVFRSRSFFSVAD